MSQPEDVVMYDLESEWLAHNQGNLQGDQLEKIPNNPTEYNTKIITTSYSSYVYNTKDNKLNVKANNLVNMELHNTKDYN